MESLQHARKHGARVAPPDHLKTKNMAILGVEFHTEYRGSRASGVRPGRTQIPVRPPAPPVVHLQQSSSFGKMGPVGPLPACYRLQVDPVSREPEQRPTHGKLAKLMLPGSTDANHSFIFRPKTASDGFYIFFYAGYLG